MTLTCVDLRFKTHGDVLDVLDTTFPHDKPQMLYWNVVSELDGDAVVEISYFTSGITWAADYVCISDSAQEKMSFEGFVRITNNSGEDYENAQVRLVVGQINLVEKIADLARRGLISKDEARGLYDRDMRVRSLKRNDARMELESAVAGRMAASEMAPKQIIKEGLSEYFIYTIEGTETVKHTWSKRMRLLEGTSVPFDIKYRYRLGQYGDQLVRLFILRNDEAGGLGTTPLPDGVVRLFRDNGRDGLAYLTAYQTKYVPIGQVIELNLGRDRQVVHERIRLRSWRDNFWFQGKHPKLYFSPTQGHQIKSNFRVAGWDDREQWVERIRNYRSKPIDVEIRRTFGGHAIFESHLEPTLYDYRTPQFSARIEAGRPTDLGYVVTYRQGINHKQDNVTLRPAG